MAVSTIRIESPMSSPALHLSQALGHEISDKRIDILRRIGQAGSISEAARDAGVSYKAAWQAIETLSNLAGQMLVEKVVGGSGGGGAQLTAAGLRLLEAADRLGQARAAVLARLGEQAGGPAAQRMAGLGLRTSMRNQLPCTVRSLRTAKGAVRVELELADASTLCSRITAESAELLGLEAGLQVIAMCKATAMSVASRFEPEAGINLLAGQVTRSSPSPEDGEISLRLPCGLQLVGFRHVKDGLSVGQRAMAAVDESAIVLALDA